MHTLRDRHARPTMDHQRRIAQSLDCTDAIFVQSIAAFLLKMHVANRDRHGINTGFTCELRGFLRVGPGRRLAAIIADKTDLALARNTSAVASSVIRAVSAMLSASGLREPSNIKLVKPLSSASWHSSNV